MPHRAGDGRFRNLDGEGVILDGSAGASFASFVVIAARLAEARVFCGSKVQFIWPPPGEGVDTILVGRSRLDGWPA